MRYPVVITDRTLTVVIDGVPEHVERSHRNWDLIKEALDDPTVTPIELRALMIPAAMVEQATVDNGKIELRFGRLYYAGTEVHSALADRIIDIINEGFDVMPWVRFAENVYANPASFSRDELYLFLEKSDLPITEDGHFLAYKMVREDYLDLHSGTFDNSIGQICEMPREAVDTDRYRTCSTGLHFCSKGYLNFYSSGARTMIVKINPADVVSIPADYDNAKGRCWRYEVIGEMPREVAKTFVWPAIAEDDDEPVELEDWDDYEPYSFDEDDVVDEDDDTPAPAPVTTSRFKNWFRRNG